MEYFLAKIRGEIPENIPGRIASETSIEHPGEILTVITEEVGAETQEYEGFWGNRFVGGIQNGTGFFCQKFTMIYRLGVIHQAVMFPCGLFCFSTEVFVVCFWGKS